MATARRCQPLLGTYVEISLSDSVGGLSRRELLEASSRAFEEIRTVQDLMNFHAAESEVARLNREAHLHAVTVNWRTFEVLESAVETSRCSGGLFDVSIAPQLVLTGRLPHPYGAPDPSASSWTSIELDRETPAIRFHRPLWIDLGGIAKGYAVDRAVAVLRALGVAQGCVNAGGDLRWLGGRAETVHVRSPKSGGAGLVELETWSDALATTAFYYQEGEQRSHIAHPQSGFLPVEEKSVTVFASSCMEADALTKVVCLASEEQAGALLEARVARGVVLSGEAPPRVLG